MGGGGVSQFDFDSFKPIQVFLHIIICHDEFTHPEYPKQGCQYGSHKGQRPCLKMASGREMGSIKHSEAYSCDLVINDA